MPRRESLPLLRVRAHRGPVAALCALAVVAACGAEPLSLPAAPRALPQLPSDRLGPFGVGVTSRFLPAVTAGSGEAEGFAVEVWYPVDRAGAWAAAAGSRTPYDGLMGMAVRDLPIAAGYERFPLLVFSHGLGAIREQNAFQVQYWASRGYVVVSGDHHPSLIWEVVAAGDLEDEGVVRSAQDRPYEIVAQLDAVERWAEDPRDPLFFRRVDARRVVVAGHSFGGYTALAVSGAEASLDALQDFCDHAVTEVADSINCKLADDVAAARTSGRIDDERVAGVIPLTPGATPLFSGGGLAATRVPVFLWGGARDDLVEPEHLIAWVYDELDVPKAYAVIPWADHLDFSQICQAALPFGCGLDAPVAPRQTLEMLNDLTTAFVDWIVRGDEAAGARLAPAAVARRYPQLVYDAEL